jgi:Ca2+-binding RTX toxin-like protein
VITGTSGNNLLDGGEGDDTLNGGAGADTMVGGNGSDTYYVDNIGDAVLESAPNGGFDIVNTAITLTMPTNVEVMYLIGSAPINGFGNDADNQIIGNSNSNTLTGGFGNDYLFGEGGADTMLGGIGNDTYNVGNVDDVIIELSGDGRDTVFSNASAYTLSANVEVLQVYATGVSGTGNELDNEIYANFRPNTLDGGAGNDLVYGAGGNDTIHGSAGDDELHGGADQDVLFGDGDNDELFGEDGKDVLAGGLGVDVMYGGIGSDRFYFADAAESGAGRASADQIMDFSAADADRIDVSAIDADITTAGHQSFTFIGNENAFYGVAQVRFNGGFVEGDIDGDLNADFRIQVNAPSLVATDFIL